jgi:glycosyltransferase involved in cell wall biosynthesis
MVPNPVRSSLPEASIYLNVAPFGTPGPIYFRWLRRRPDIKAVFFVHDLLPLDYPELFPSEWYRFHRQMISAMMERASGVIVASDAVRERVQRELSAHGASHVKVHVAHLPPGPTFRERSLGDPVLQAHPYFVMCGTIEPRKNHRLVLEVWRQFRREHSSSTPRLILIGKRGWMSDQTFAMLDNEVSLSSVILEASAVPDSVQHWLLSNACAALCPSRAEGYGLPLVEALSVGTPVVASAIPVFREVSQGFASFCHPGDLEHWKRTISSLSDRSACTWAAAEVRTRQFRPPTMEGYFTSVMQFLEAL